MKEMTPKERVMAFFRHEPVDELPTDEGIFVLFNPEAYKERPSHEHGGVDWFGVPWKYESSVDAIAPDHSVEPIMEDICDWRELVKFPDLDAWDWSKVEEIDHISEIDRENKIINDLLSLVKMDKSAGNINITSVQINELLERIMKRLRPIAQKQNVELVMESFRPVVAEVDEVKLTLALTNLIENAIKYNNPDGWVHVSLNADHQNFFVTVEDNGIGIPKEAQNRIFERFYRVDKSHSREIGGTGLGLSIARNAVVMHRGAIKVYSEPGEGTTFTVRIPLTYIKREG